MDRAGRIGVALRQRPASEPLGDAVTSAVLQHYDPADAPQRRWMHGLRRVLTSPAMQGEYLKGECRNAAHPRQVTREWSFGGEGLEIGTGGWKL